MDERNEYAYLLCVGGKILKIIAKWWSTPQEAHENMAAMHAAAELWFDVGNERYTTTNRQQKQVQRCGLM